MFTPYSGVLRLAAPEDLGASPAVAGIPVFAVRTTYPRWEMAAIYGLCCQAMHPSRRASQVSSRTVVE